MKQVTQRLRDGRIEVLEVPPPTLTPGGVIVDVRASLLSAGTERTKVETGRKSLVGKARSRPDQVRQVTDKVKRDGLRATVEAVRMRLNEPSALGYSAAGVVSSVGARVSDVRPGDRVACGGGDHAVHAEVVHVPSNLCVPLPDAVGLDEGAFVTIGSIALHGVRQADVRIGERVAVVGLGLVGQLAAQILRASGCAVVGIDLAPDLVELARKLGAVDTGLIRADLDDADLPSEARGCDAVLITAATRSDDPVELAAALCRDRGRVVVVGDVGMAVPRAAYYGKELELRLSRSYGPGRYDREYEERGLDYPIGYVRWTERRNMQAFAELVAAGKVDVKALITDHVPVDEAPAAYERLLEEERSPLGIVLEYGPALAPAKPPPKESARRAPSAAATAAGVIGAGSFAQRILIPALADAGFSLARVASATGLSARSAADRFGFEAAVTADEVIDDPGAGLVVIATRHSSHAELACAALRAGKAVFVEKPPALTESELRALSDAASETGLPVAVGFNRRHAPLARALRDHVTAERPFQLLYRVRPDRLPADHWLLDPEEGGGPLLGEGCHFVDFACWLAGATPRRVSCALQADEGVALAAAQRFAVVLEFADGSLATITYGPTGSPAIGKEQIEVHAGDRTALLDDFRRLTLHMGRRRTTKTSRTQDKGHRPQMAHLRRVLESDAESDPVGPLESMRVTLAALESGSIGRAVDPLEVGPREIGDGG